MSEHTQSQTLARENYDDENDPLAELARIVAGEPEPTVSDEPSIDPVAEQVQPVSADLAPDPFLDVDQAIDEAAGELQSWGTKVARVARIRSRVSWALGSPAMTTSRAPEARWSTAIRS